ncbi:MAG: WD40 repeat domain-containing protein [Coleofasciculus chthonoplastes F3-SA18-01]|uniref:WD40 repeat domain-containing protein n=1 Tax=Coleofasciculus chthonoplastes TaxID=64178 RepID=UPI0032F43912
MLTHRLKIAECIFVAVSIIGWAVAAASGQIIYGAVPLSIALLLNLINRLRFEQQSRNRLTGAMAQLHRQVSQESQSLYQQQQKQALASLQAKLPDYLAQIENPASELGAIKIAQLQARIVSVEQSLRNVVDYLNSASLPNHIEQLEAAIAQVTADLDKLHYQIPIAAAPEQPTHWHTEAGGEPSLFPVASESVSPVSKAEEVCRDVPVERLGEDVRAYSSRVVPEPILPNWNFRLTLKGHQDWVSALAMSADGQILVSGSLDKTVKLWHLETADLIHTFSDHQQGILCLSLSPDGKWLASGGFDQTIKVWKLETGELCHTLIGHNGSVRSLVIMPDNQTLISGSFDQTIKLWQLDQGKFVQDLVQDAGRLSAIALSPDGKTLASGGGDGIVDLWHFQPFDLEFSLTDNLSSINSLALSPDGRRLAAACTDGTLKVWQLDRAELIEMWQCPSAPAMSIVFSDNQQSAIAAHADGTIKIWWLGIDEPLLVLDNNDAGSVVSVALSPDGQWLAGGNRDGTVKLWQQF